MRVQTVASAQPVSGLLAVLEPGDTVLESLLALASNAGIEAASVSGLGAFERAELAFFDRARRAYDAFTVGEQSEVLSFIGNLALYEGEPRMHAHVVLGLPDGSTRGGHLVDAVVWPTLELSVTVWPSRLVREVHDESGLPLIAPV